MDPDNEKKLLRLTRTVRELKNENDALRSMTEALPDMICRIRPDGNFEYLNKAWEKALGFPKQELMLLNLFRELVHPDDHFDLMNRISKKIHKNEELVFECRIRRRDGSYGNFEWMYYRSHTSGIIVILKDHSSVTDQREPAVLKKMEWKNTFNAIKDWICLLDENNRIILSNRSQTFITDAAPESVVGMTCCQLIHGREKPLAICPILKMRKTLERESEREAVEVHNERLNKWLEVSANPILNDQGGFVYSILVIRDITMQKQMENKIIQNRKAESFSALSAGIAHDYNNLLTVIMGSISLAHEESRPDGNIRQYLADAQKASYEARDLTYKFMELAEGLHHPRMEDTLEATIGFTLNEEIRHTKVSAEFNSDSRLFIIKYDPVSIMQMIRHLARNAAEAMPNGGKLTVSLSNLEISETNAHQFLFPKGEYVLLTFKDTGVGIPHENLDKIFDPYFSTKERGAERAMGFGLTSVFSTVKKHKGFIHITSETESGTLIEIALPKYRTPRTAVSELPVHPEKGKRLILALEDDAILRKLYKIMIEKNGDAAVIVETGEEAIAAYRKARSEGYEFNLLLFDQGIKGGLNGVDALQAIRRINPKVRAVIISGSPSYPVLSAYKDHGFSERLLKPFSYSELKKTIENVCGPA